MSDLIAVTTTCPSLEEAERVGGALLQARLAAGIQIERVLSRYRWAGQLNGAEEWRLKAWSRRSLAERVRGKIREEHSYDVFEFTTTPLEPASGPFADWVRENVPAHAI